MSTVKNCYRLETEIPNHKATMCATFDIDGNSLILDDGMRAFRLKKPMSACPDFDNPLHKQAWKHGFRQALQRRTLNEALNCFGKEN